MNSTEFLLSLLPLVLIFAATVWLVWKTGTLSQREHRKRVEILLERIALAVETQNKS